MLNALGRFWGRIGREEAAAPEAPAPTPLATGADVPSALSRDGCARDLYLYTIISYLLLYKIACFSIYFLLIFLKHTPTLL